MAETKNIFKKLTITGLVQGIGFRPFVKLAAEKYNISGNVKNNSGALEIFLSADNNSFILFLNEIKSYFPADIKNICQEDILPFSEDGFYISKSDSNNNNIIIIPPDFSICPDCEKEINNKSDRRYMHSLNSCVICGPRFSIIKNSPYDRINTSMSDFDMCDKCKNEYIKSTERRFHAQTVSCPDCEPHIFYNNSKTPISDAVSDLKNGNVIAIKGIGGFHLTCSPFDKNALENIRKIKKRDKKPFAVMFSNIDEIKKHCYVNEEEEKLLTSKAKPIVLLKFKSNPFHELVCYGSPVCGCFLPYTPLQLLILNEIKTLVMTSANISSNPIITNEKKLPEIDILTHNREILRPLDDSAAKIINNKPQILRRARGYTPLPLYITKSNIEMLALGGDLKSSFCLTKGNCAYISQYFGDFSNMDVQENYIRELHNYKNIFKINPEIAVCDLHPLYHTAAFAKSLSIPIKYIQHHHAHIASVIAEHNITDKIIGVAFDGTGFGDDGNIWGGEFLICDKAEYKRHSHLKYQKLINAVENTQTIAECFLYNNDIVKKALDNNINTFLSSSMGRLFDAVSSILNISHYNSYEGESAILLEKHSYLGVNPTKMEFSFKGNEILYDKLLNTILEAVNEKQNISDIALGFHYAVSDMILRNCLRINEVYNINKVALAGGVFQNTLLTERTIKILKENDFLVYINQKLPPNDQSICYGQAYIVLKQ